MSAQSADRSHRQPNVVIILPDQLRWSALGCYGNPVIKSPNINRLADEGVRFTHAFSNFPVCSPARSTLLTGRYARSNGVNQNQDPECQSGRSTTTHTTLAEALAAAGYKTALVGKWHLFPKPQALGFQQSLRANYPHGYFKQKFTVNEKEVYYHQGYGPFYETEKAVEFIRLNRDRPFFLYFSPHPPHMPIADLPNKYKNMYQPDELPIRPNAIKDGKPAYNEEWFKIYMWEHRYLRNPDTYPEKLPEGMDLRDLTALYYGQITAIDDCVGQVMKALKDNAIDADTIVVFTTDHGDLLGSHQLFNKNHHYIEACRIPMMVRYPRKLTPRVIDKQVISLIDVMPTILELCGVSVPPSVQGLSMDAVLTSRQTVIGENAAYIETTSSDGIRTLRYMYAIERESGNELLFDVEADPYEMNNLIDRPTYKKILLAMREKVKSWQKQTTEFKFEK
ncbi:MAG: sulfatase-like hydrolase/transferase [Planctomycetota bacterium]|nr:MAG: sulfatase-like hydrolase/transferase [Planctomycetota bacterium]